MLSDGRHLSFLENKSSLYLRSYQILSRSKNSRGTIWVELLAGNVLVSNRDRSNRENDSGMAQSLFNSRAAGTISITIGIYPTNVLARPLSRKERERHSSRFSSSANKNRVRALLFRRRRGLRSCTICKFRPRCNLVTPRSNRLNREHATACVHDRDVFTLVYSYYEMTRQVSPRRIAHGN